MANDSTDPPATGEPTSVRSRETRYSRVPDWVLETGDPKAILTYTALASFANREGEAHPKHATLGARVGLSVSAIQRGLRTLRDLGAVEVEAQFGRGVGRQVENVYVLAFDDPRSVPPTERGRSQGPSAVGPTDRPITTGKDELEVQPAVAHSEKPPRPEVTELCALLATHVGAVTGAKPVVTKAWLRDMRLTLDRPRGVDSPPWTAEQVEYVIGWLGKSGERSQFWSVNVRCPSKLRAQMERLVEEIKLERRTGTSSASRIERIRDAAANPPAEEGIFARTVREQREQREARRAAVADREQRIRASLGTGS